MIKNRMVNICFLLILAAVLLMNIFFSISPWVYVAIILVFIATQVYGSFVLSAGFFLPVHYSGDKSAGSIALTFDDGPLAGKTERILNILKTHAIPAAFFCVGKRVEENPGIATRIANEGHILGNHSFEHGIFFDLQSSGAIEAELSSTDALIQQHTGFTPRFFRPPYGVTNPMVASAVRRNGYVTIGWSMRSFDTLTKNSKRLLKKITRSLKSGDVILLHDSSESTIEMLPSLLKEVEKVGLKIVRLDELINEEPYVR
jgi:peptidoglycan/xylan/chitin deacetylase (PgdA/CDA1 family)